jgi:hypothetical protein
VFFRGSTPNDGENEAENPMFTSVTQQFEPHLVGADVTWEVVNPYPEASPQIVTYGCWSCGAETEVVLGSERPICCEQRMTLTPLLALTS